VHDARLAKKWKSAEVMLFQAAQFLDDPSIFSFAAIELEQYRFDLRKLEITNAMNELALLGEHFSTKPSFWRRIEKVAKQIDATDKAKEFEHKFHKALAINV
jgi:hypothetical protein